MQPSASPTESAGGKDGGAPIVLGAIGRFDRERILETVARLNLPLRPAYEDARAFLMLDREPIRWQGVREHGLAWTQGVLWRGAATDWKQASRLGACGLVLRGKQHLIHSGISGLAPVYWAERDRATYFSSRLGLLVAALPGRLSIDWDAWASILIMRYPLGERTPFAEIRRLGPFSAARRRLGGTRIERPASPWVALEPSLDLDTGADAMVAALEEVVSPLEGPVVCPLSGGNDSRMLACLLAGRRGLPVTALTVSDDEGGRFEEDLAASVAERLDCPHEQLRGCPGDYPDDWRLRAERVEYQFVDHAWLVPLARRIASARAPVPDGYALDSFLLAGSRFLSPAVMNAPGARAASEALFDSARQFGHAQLALTPKFHTPLIARARAQFLEAAAPFEGHPSQALLALYMTRSVRGVSTYPAGLLGHGAQVIAPGSDDRVATVALSMTPRAKYGGRAYTAIYERLAPEVGRLPSTGDSIRQPAHLPVRWRSQPAIHAYRHRLDDGPLAAHVAPELRSWIESPAPGPLNAHLRLGLEGITLFHEWCDRYRDRLEDFSVADLLST